MQYRFLSGLFVLILEIEISKQQEVLDVSDDEASFDKVIYTIPGAGILIIVIVGLSYLIYTWYQTLKVEAQVRSWDKDNTDVNDEHLSTGQSEDFTYVCTPEPAPPPPYGVDLNAIANSKDPPPSYSEAIKQR